MTRKWLDIILRQNTARVYVHFFRSAIGKCVSEWNERQRVSELEQRDKFLEAAARARETDRQTDRQKVSERLARKNQMGKMERDGEQERG